MADDDIRPRDVRFDWAVKIPIRTGLRLNATIYRPKELDEAVPCIVTITPYIADEYHERGVYFASHGFPFIIVDAQGRGNSDGVFQPFSQEAKDGYDVIEWIARQSYCDGHVAMWGGSYSGYNQWAAAKEFPPHLSTIVPAGAPYLGLDFPMRNNIWLPYVMQWLTYTLGRTGQTKLFSDSHWWSSKFREWHDSGRPFDTLDVMLGTPSSVFQEWLCHPEPDSWWDLYNPSTEEYAQLGLPILTITGMYDDDQPGALAHYEHHLSYASTHARSLHHLVIGPWDHAGTRTPRSSVGGVEFGVESLVDLNKLHLDWYRWTMEGQAKPPFLQDQVAYYLTGANRWKYARSLKDISTVQRRFFLTSLGKAAHLRASGRLQNTASEGPPDVYTYNPLDLRGPELDAEERASGGSLTDQAVVQALGDRALVYDTAPLDMDLEVSGFFRLSAWISIDCPDADFYVSVHEIAPNGSSIRLSSDALRARYRRGLRMPELIKTSSPLRYDFNRFTFAAREVKRGSRLRLVVAPMGRIMETTFMEKNYHGGGAVARESAESARAVTVSLFHQGPYISVLYVPVCEKPLADESGTGNVALWKEDGMMGLNL